MLIVMTNRRGAHWRVNLTDRANVFDPRAFPDAPSALRHVERLIRLGHRPVFQSAMLDLLAAAEPPTPAA